MEAAMASHRRTVAAAFAVLLASVSLYPIFTGIVWFFAGAGAISVVAVTGTATRLRRLPVPLTVLAPVITLLLYLNLGFSSLHSLYHLLPTPTSLHDLSRLAGEGFTESAKYAPPVPELRGMVLLAAAGIGITAVLTDLIAVRLGSAALAGLPLLLLFTEPFTLSVSRGFLGTTIAFCATVAGFLGLLSSEGRDRIREWEHPGPGAGRVPDTRALAATGRRVGFASVAVALLLPLLIPGLHTTRLFGGRPGIGGTGGSASAQSGSAGFPDPNTQLSKELHEPRPSTLLVYKTANPVPDYLQLYVLDRLTDSGWQLFTLPESLAAVSPRLPAPPGLTTDAWVSTETTTVSVERDVGADFLTALPVPYPTTTVTARGAAHGTADWRADRNTLMVFASPGSLGGLTYTVTSLAEAPAAALLRAAPAAPQDIRAHFLAVPASYDSLRPLAESLVKAAGAKNAFDDAIALQDWLADGAFGYTLNAPTVLNAQALARFLTVTKRGYCQQFSFAMAVLARLLGIPSRVAYGFTSGTSARGGEWQVATSDAHAWPELYFQGYGWLRFEPTPSGPSGQGTASTPAYALPSAGATTSPGETATGNGSITFAGGQPRAGKALNRKLQTELHETRPLGDGPGSGTAPGAARHGGGLLAWAVIGLVLAGLVLLAGVAPWCTRLVIRRRRWGQTPRRGGGRLTDRDIARAHAAWRELRDDLIDHGAGYQPSESPRAAAARAGAALSFAEPAQAAVGRIALAEERARYSAQPADGSGLRADSIAVRRAIAASVPGQAKWRARLWPASVVSPALGALAAAADRYRGLFGPGGTRLGFPFLPSAPAFV
jgi:transglutaminase-like putative cysteine protease